MSVCDFGITEPCPYIGKGIIFSFENFTDDRVTDREGAEKDRNVLFEMLQQMGLLVSVELNCTLFDFNTVLKRLEFEKQLNLFVCVFLSHGHSNKYFLTSDCKSVDIESVLLQFENFSSMKPIVKLYVANFCRSEDEVSGMDDEKCSELKSEITHLTNTLKVFSTLPGSDARRNKKQGSYFINQFVKAVQTSRPYYEIESIMTETNVLMKRKLSSKLHKDLSNEQALHIEYCNFNLQYALRPKYNKDMRQWIHSAIVQETHDNNPLLNNMDNIFKSLFRSKMTSLNGLFHNFHTTYLKTLSTTTTIESMDMTFWWDSIFSDLADSDRTLVINILSGNVPVQSWFGVRYCILSLQHCTPSALLGSKVLCVANSILQLLQECSIDNESELNCVLLYDNLISVFTALFIQQVSQMNNVLLTEIVQFIYYILHSSWMYNKIKEIKHKNNFFVNKQHVDPINLITWSDLLERFVTIDYNLGIKDIPHRVNSTLRGDCYMFEPNISLYVGNIKTSDEGNKLREGPGIASIANGVVYDGTWNANKRHGHGYAQLSDGFHYVGQWVDDKPCGQGTYTFSNGDYFEGEFEPDVITGYGEHYVKECGTYFGHIVNMQYDGPGCIMFPNGNVFKGDFELGKNIVPGTLIDIKDGSESAWDFVVFGRN